MTLDAALIAFVKEQEGFVSCAQWDFHQWTNGYGTRAHDHRECISQAEAERRLIIELSAAQASVVAFCSGLPQGVLNALTDLTYNAGAMWMHMGLGDEVKAGDWVQAKAHLLMYEKAGGKNRPDLEKRRKAEASWF